MVYAEERRGLFHWRNLMLLALISCVLLMVLFLVNRQETAYAQGQVIVVNTDEDLKDSALCTDADCSLREAIWTANTTAGSEPVTITFQEPYVITLTYIYDGMYIHLPSINRTYGPVYLDGDLDDDGRPDVIINGQNITVPGSVGLWVKSNDVVIDGIIVQNFDAYECDESGCRGSYGIDVWGDRVRIVNSRIFSNYIGIIFTNDAAYGVVTNSVVAGNLDTGIRISAKVDRYNPSIITPAHHITITNSYIGVDRDGSPWGNDAEGVLIQRGVSYSLIISNIIAHNGCYGIYIRGGSGVGRDTFAPPHGNEIRENLIAHNSGSCFPQAAIVNDRTHNPPGDIPTLAGGYDNIIVGNVITANTGIGIYNVGASPFITGNDIVNNASYGIYNLVDFGVDYSPLHADDDILSIPIIKNNYLDGNGEYGIRSLDTAPADRYTLHQDNTIGEHSLGDVLQYWLGAVEVLTGTVDAPRPITQSITVRILGHGTGLQYDLGSYASASPYYTSGIWARSGVTFTDAGTWFPIEEFRVENDGTLVNHLTHTVQVYINGVYTGVVYFSFDGITSTDPVSGDVLIPAYVATGPFGRYQVAEVNFTRDADQDTIPDIVEGTEDPDDDGMPNYLDTDSDGDTIPDEVDGYEDTDGDGIPNYLDTDSDGDGIPDEIEGVDDPDEDGVPNFLDLDSDGDGIPDEIEGVDDPDGDGVPNFLDLDSDGDGVPDWEEAGCMDEDTDCQADPGSCPEELPDTDGDNIPDYLDNDSDGDGILDCVEYISESDCVDPNTVNCPEDVPCTNSTLDTDDDGIPNCQDNDADGDGIPNYLDRDSDGDGIPDVEEGTQDTDNDGVPDYLDPLRRLYLPLILRR